MRRSLLLHTGTGQLAPSAADHRRALLEEYRHPDMAALENFLAKPELRESRGKAGVLSPPTVIAGLAT